MIAKLICWWRMGHIPTVYRWCNGCRAEHCYCETCGEFLGTVPMGFNEKGERVV